MASAGRSDLEQFWTALVYQVRSYVRTRRFLGLVLFVAVVSAVVLGVDFYQGAAAIKVASPSADGFLSGYLGSVGLVAVISAAFLGGDALAVDLAGGPGYLMLTQPVRRGTLLAGRYAAAALTVAAIVVVYYAFAVGGALAFYGAIPLALTVSLGAAFLYGLSVLAVAFFFSSFFKTSAVSIIASLLILFLGFPILTSVGTLTGSEPWYSLDYGSGIISNVLNPNFQHETITEVGGGPGGVTIKLYTWSPFLVEGVAIVVVYLVAFLALSFVIYRYKEVKG